MDIKDAFHLIPFIPDEWRFVCTAIAGKYYVFKVVIVGAAPPHHLPQGAQGV